MSYFRYVLSAVLIITAIALLGFVGEMDYQDALAEEAHYTSMVCAGYWPDYKDLGISCEAQQRANAGGNVSF
jgi:hypothetical protein